MDAISLTDVCFTYEDGHCALDGLNLTVAPGERVALVGPNGAGKSTLLHILAALYTPTKGTVEINGLKVTKRDAAAARRHVGLLFQDPDDQIFMPTVWEDVAFGPINMGLDRKEVARRVEEALKMTTMLDYRDRVPHHLSLGEKKKVAMAGLLAMSPDILLLDEPTANLDPQGKRELIGVLQNRHETTVIATHDLAVAFELAERVIVLKRRIIFDGSFRKLVDDRQTLREARLELPSFSRLMKIWQERSNARFEPPLTVEEAAEILLKRKD